MKYLILVIFCAITLVSAVGALIISYFFVYIPSKSKEMMELSTKMKAVKQGLNSKENDKTNEEE